MKKKVLFSLIVIISLFIVTGCGNGKTSSNNLHKIEFVDMDGYKVLVYRFNDDEKKTINLYYNENTSGFDTDEDYEEVTINSVKWKKFHSTDFGVTYDTYKYVYNNALYTIELNEVDKYKDEFDEFMKSVAFE